MNISAQFRPYKKRLVWEAFMQSFLLSLSLGAVSVLISALIYCIKKEDPPYLLVLAAGGTVFVITLVLFFLLFYPTNKSIARRLDALGLAERVGTMLELEKTETDIARLQRQDAIEHMKKLSPKDVPLGVQKRHWLLCLLSLCLAAVLLFLPPYLRAQQIADDPELVKQMQITDGLMEQLRQVVRDAFMDDTVKTSLYESIDNLEGALKTTASQLEKTALIDQSQKEMEQILTEAMTKFKIGAALEQYALTFSLGDSIIKGQMDPVIEALDYLQAEIEGDASLLAKVSELLTSALAIADTDPADKLHRAIADLAETLSSLNPASGSYAEDLTAAFDTAETAIIWALEEQKTMGAVKEKLAELMTSAKDSLLGYQRVILGESDTLLVEDSDGSGFDSDEIEGNPEASGSAPGGPGENTAGGAKGEEDAENQSMTEGIYDPLSGKVSYGEVFSAYYAKYLAALSAGEVPAELQKIIDNYYIALN